MCHSHIFVSSSFPIGHRRGERDSKDTLSSIRLDPTSPDGPIHMLLSELNPDTILIHEVDTTSGRLVMTSSLSLVTDFTADSSIVQLIQVSHEVSGPKTSPKPSDSIIEGHQVWRFRRKEAYQ